MFPFQKSYRDRTDRVVIIWTTGLFSILGMLLLAPIFCCMEFKEGQAGEKFLLYFLFMVLFIVPKYHWVSGSLFPISLEKLKDRHTFYRSLRTPYWNRIFFPKLSHYHLLSVFIIKLWHHQDYSYGGRHVGLQLLQSIVVPGNPSVQHLEGQRISQSWAKASRSMYVLRFSF